jgi:formate dehydrogenase major subunit
MTNSIGDLGMADVILVVGSNTTEAHPIIGIELKRAARLGKRIIVVDPRRIRLVDHADQWLQIEAGTNVALLNAMMRVILDEGLADESFIEKRTEGFDGLRTVLAEYAPEIVSEIIGVSAQEIRAAARAYASADAAAIVYCMGVTQHESGTAQVRSLANLAMLTGNMGRPGTGVNPLRGQNNVQGACDMACLPGNLPGYARVDDDADRARFEKAWGTKLSSKCGLTLTEAMDAAADGEVRAMYIMGENPVLSDPDQAHVIEALEKLDFLVVQDLFMTETAALADVVLPGAAFVEKDGTFTNTERRVQRVRAVVPSPGDARSDLRIITEISSVLGYPMSYADPSQVMAEIAEVTPSYGGITYERLDTGGLQWPCLTETHSGTPILHAESFTRGRGVFAPVEYVPPSDTVDGEYPFVLTTGRELWNFHTNTLTERSAGLADLNPVAHVEVNPIDAERLGVCDDDWIEVSSRQGAVSVQVRVSDRPKRGLLFMPFHFRAAPANRLTSTRRDPIAKIPGLKYNSVSVRPCEAPTTDG